jgi:hypothetical protein
MNGKEKWGIGVTIDPVKNEPDSYWYPLTENPNLFSQGLECCSDKERDAWLADKKEWDEFTGRGHRLVLATVKNKQNEEEKVFAWLHGWGFDAITETVMSSVAIIELEDGEVKMVNPWDIKFLDRDGHGND